MTVLGIVAGIHLQLAVAAGEPGDLTSLDPLAITSPAPDFTLIDTDGQTHTLSDYRGQPVIVSFWATWCTPCRKEMPSMQRAWEMLKGHDVMLLAVNVGDSQDWIDQFRGSFDMAFTFPFVMDEDSSQLKPWGVKGLPSSYVIDPQGQIVYEAIGEKEWDHARIIDQILALKSS